jgi:hypothetical protein
MDRTGTVIASLPGMNVNTATLRALAKEINRNPLWGMLCVREYYDPEHPLFKALATKASRLLNNRNYPDAALRFADRIISGDLFEINDVLRKSLRPLPAKLKQPVLQLTAPQIKRSQKRRSGKSLTLKVTGQTAYRGTGHSSRRFSSNYQGGL